MPTKKARDAGVFPRLGKNRLNFSKAWKIFGEIFQPLEKPARRVSNLWKN
jgi:hypothetical protein